MNYSKQKFKNRKFREDELDKSNCSGCTFENCELPFVVLMSNFSRSKFINCVLHKFVDCNLSFVNVPDGVLTIRCNRNMVEGQPIIEIPSVPEEIKPDENNIIKCPTCGEEIKVKK